MTIRTASFDELCQCVYSEGLVLRVGDKNPYDMVSAVSDALTNDGALLHGDRFEEAYAFTHNGTAYMLLPLSGTLHLDIGKLAMWRLRSFGTFRGVWFSEFKGQANIAQ